MDTNDFEKMERERLTNPYAERWDGAMDDAPDYIGENPDGSPSEYATLDGQEHPGQPPEYADPFNQASNIALDASQPIENPAVAAENGEQIRGANKLAGYGLDVASREYGVDAVVKAIRNIDLTDRDVDQPIGAIYQQLTPGREARQDLFQKISADEDYRREALATTRTLTEQRDAVAAAQRLFEALEQDDRFAPLRAQAEAQGQDVVTFLVNGQVKPTLSDLLGKVGDNFDLDAVAEEIVEEVQADEDAISDTPTPSQPEYPSAQYSPPAVNPESRPTAQNPAQPAPLPSPESAPLAQP